MNRKINYIIVLFILLVTTVVQAQDPGVLDTSDADLVSAGRMDSLGNELINSNWQLSLKYFLKASAIYTNLEQDNKLAEIYKKIGSKYYSMGVYSLAYEYAEKEFDLRTGSVLKCESAMLAARSAYYQADYNKSQSWYKEAYIIAESDGNSELKIKTLYGLSGVKSAMHEYRETAAYLKDLLKLKEEGNDTEGIADVYNSLGLLDFESGNIDGAINNYQQAITYYKLSSGGLEEVYSNLAICYQNKDNNKLSEEYFEMALDEAESSGNTFHKARVEHILAVLNFKEGDLYHADYYCLAGIESAQKSNNYNVLQKVYLTYSEILEEGNDFVRALEYYQKHLSLKDSLAIESRFRDQALSAKREGYENYEQQLRLSLADDAVKDLELRNLRVENEKRMNDMKLLESVNEVALLEKGRLQQNVVLEKERYNSAMQEKEIMLLEQQRIIQRRDSILQEAEARKLTQENRELEYEAEIQQNKLEKEQQKRRGAFLLAISSGFTLLIILLSLISSRRKNITLTRQKKIIEEKNTTITDSIEYASRIQNAVLPPAGFLKELGLENFIMFRPKDIVSGDFYWGMESGDKLCFAAADCTGHGVPGAFMSMLGSAFLNEIINSRQFDNAADILNQLRNEVITSLKQKGVEGEAQDGMDIALCVYDRKKNILHFSGANNPLYHVRNGSIERVGADKMPIGIHRSLDKSFTNYTIEPEKGDLIYLFSDGYADQFGGEEGKKFKYKPFRDMLLKISSLSMDEQLRIVEDRFDNWKKDVEQVDDIILLGIKF